MVLDMLVGPRQRNRAVAENLTFIVTLRLLPDAMLTYSRSGPRCSIKLTHLRSGKSILRVRGRWRPGTSGWVHFIRGFLCSAATRFLRPGHMHRTAPRAAAVKTGRRPLPQAVVLTAVSMVRASTRPARAPRGSQLAMDGTIC